jgi:hypothetical protein
MWHGTLAWFPHHSGLGQLRAQLNGRTEYRQMVDVRPLTRPGSAYLIAISYPSHGFFTWWVAVLGLILLSAALVGVWRVLI